VIDSHSGRDSIAPQVLDQFINVVLLVLLGGTCFIILRPFLLLILWGIIIAIAVYPTYVRFRSWLGGRSGLAAVICTGLLLILFIAPIVLVTGSLIEGLQRVGGRLTDGMPIVPPPPPRVANWPLIGQPLKDAWELMSKNVAAAVRAFAPQIRSVIPRLLSASADLGLAVLQLGLSILVAGILLAGASTGARIAHSLAFRLFGDKGPEFEELAAATVRSVTIGILGVALIQSACAALGFLLAGLPGAGVWALMFLFAAVLQAGVVVLVPAVIYMFATASTMKAILFLVWCGVVGIMDNVLKPLLLARGVPVPMAVVFLGAVGGLITMGTIGLFAGAIVLSIGYKLFLLWLYDNSQLNAQSLKRSVSVQMGL
jgi:predicted PurR-regulated permease PerM